MSSYHMDSNDLFDLLQSQQPLDPHMIRDKYPAWIDDDIRQNLESLFVEPTKEEPTRNNNNKHQPSSQPSQSHQPNQASIEYQRMLNEMANEIRSKQFAMTNRSSSSTRPPREEPPHPAPPTPHPPPSPAVRQLAQSQGARHQTQQPAPSASAYSSSSHLSHSHSQPSHPRTISPRRLHHRPLSGSSVTKTPTRTGGAVSQRGGGNVSVGPPRINVPDVAATPITSPRAIASSHSLTHSHSGSTLHPPSHPPPSQPHPLYPTSPRVRVGLSPSRMVVEPPDTDMISVPRAWFFEMEKKLQTLSEMGAVVVDDHGPLIEQSNKSSELQRLKYAMLMSKLEDMNRLHRDVLNEEHQKQHLKDLESLQQQHLREFHLRLKEAQEELKRLHEERNSERHTFEQQRSSERQMFDRWSTEKDESIESLRTYFLKREELLCDTHRKMEESFQQQKLQWSQQCQKDLEQRDTERRSSEKVRQELSEQVSELRLRENGLLERLNQSQTECDSLKRRLEVSEMDLQRMKLKVEEASQRMALVDSLTTQLHRLKEEHEDSKQCLKSKEAWLQEQQQDIERREQRLHSLQHEIEQREIERREMRRRERREGMQFNHGGGGIGSIGSLYRAGPDSYDCAWASGPIDRNLLLTQETSNASRSASTQVPHQHQR